MNREATLKKAEKLLRDGKLGAAIEEYVRLVDESPDDWSAVNALGDLYLKANKPGLAIAQFTRMGDHLFGEGFLPKAQAVYKKALKVDAGHKHTLRQLAEIATRQGLLADARHYLRQLGEVPTAETPAVRRKGAVGPIETSQAETTGTPAVSQAAADTPAAEPSEQPAPPEPVAPEQPTAEPVMEPPTAELSVAELPIPELSVPEPVFPAPPPTPAVPVAPVPVELPPPPEAAATMAVQAPAVAPLAAESPEPGELPVIAGEAIAVPVAMMPAAQSIQPPIESPPSPRDAASIGVLEVDLSDVLNELELVDLSPAVAETPAPVQDKPKSLASVFADLRSAATFGQQEATASAHFQLATRHLEAARWDEAIAEFETAARAPALLFEAGSQLGRLLLSRGMLQEGIDWLERAIEAPAPDAGARLALMYELAEALEQIEEWARALAVLLEVNAEAPQYRDVDARLARLTRLVSES